MCFRRLLQTSTYVYSFKVCAENRIGAGIIAGGGTLLFGLYGDVPLDRVWFLASLS